MAPVGVTVEIREIVFGTAMLLSEPPCCAKGAIIVRIEICSGEVVRAFTTMMAKRTRPGCSDENCRQ